MQLPFCFNNVFKSISEIKIGQQFEKANSRVLSEGLLFLDVDQSWIIDQDHYPDGVWMTNVFQSLISFNIQIINPFQIQQRQGMIETSITSLARQSKSRFLKGLRLNLIKQYLDRFKSVWIKCKYGEQWTFSHLIMHDSDLFEKFEQELDSYLLSGSEIYSLQFYQDFVCESIQILYERFNNLVLRHQEPVQAQT